MMKLIFDRKVPDENGNITKLRISGDKLWAYNFNFI
jgi:hypothetical protein